MKFGTVCFGIAVVGFMLASAVKAHAAPIELTCNMQNPERGLLMEIAQKPWAAEIEKRTNGRVKIVFYWAGGLGNPMQNYDLARKGVTDIGWTFASYYPGRFPMTSVMELPFQFNTGLEASRANWEMYEKHLREEYKDVHLLTLASTPPTDIWLTKKEVRTLEDLKGLKIRVAGQMPTMMINYLGATPVLMHISEVYEAMQRGTIDGVFVGRSPMMTFRFHEVTKYGVEANIFCQNYFYVMNLDKWNSLPPDIQKIMNEVSGMHHAELNGKGFDDEADFVTQKLLPKAGVQVYKLPPEEQARWVKAIDPIYDWWLKEMGSKGLPAKNLVEEVRRLSAKYTGGK